MTLAEVTMDLRRLLENSIGVSSPEDDVANMDAFFKKLLADGKLPGYTAVECRLSPDGTCAVTLTPVQPIIVNV